MRSSSETSKLASKGSFGGMLMSTCLALTSFRPSGPATYAWIPLSLRSMLVTREESSTELFFLSRFAAAV